MCIVIDTIVGASTSLASIPLSTTPTPNPERIRHRLVRFRSESVNQKMLCFFFRIEFLKHWVSYTEYMLFAFIPVGIYSAMFSFMNCVERHVFRFVGLFWYNI